MRKRPCSKQIENVASALKALAKRYDQAPFCAQGHTPSSLFVEPDLVTNWRKKEREQGQRQDRHRPDDSRHQESSAEAPPVDPQLAELYELAPYASEHQTHGWRSFFKQLSRPALTILGAPGSGKSFGALATATVMAADAAQALEKGMIKVKDLCLPVLLAAKSAVNCHGEQGLLQLLELAWGGESKHLLDLVSHDDPEGWNGRYLVFIDGLDEVERSGPRVSQLRDLLGKLHALRFPTILTCRTADWAQWENRLPDSFTNIENVATLAPLSYPQQRDYLYNRFNYDHSFATQVVQSIGTNLALRHAASIPLLLEMTARLAERKGAARLSKQLRVTGLYAEIMDLYLQGVWRSPEEDPSIRSDTTESKLRESWSDKHSRRTLLRWLSSQAFRLLQWEESTEKNKFDWEQWDDSSKYAERLGWEPLKLASGEKALSKDLLKHLEKLGLLIEASRIEADGEEQWSFAHRSLLEFLAARGWHADTEALKALCGKRAGDGTCLFPIVASKGFGETETEWVTPLRFRPYLDTALRFLEELLRRPEAEALMSAFEAEPEDVFLTMTVYKANLASIQSHLLSENRLITLRKRIAEVLTGSSDGHVSFDYLPLIQMTPLDPALIDSLSQRFALAIAGAYRTDDPKRQREAQLLNALGPRERMRLAIDLLEIADRPDPSETEKMRARRPANEITPEKALGCLPNVIRDLESAEIGSVVQALLNRATRREHRWMVIYPLSQLIVCVDSPTRSRITDLVVTSSLEYDGDDRWSYYSTGAYALEAMIQDLGPSALNRIIDRLLPEFYASPNPIIVRALENIAPLVDRKRRERIVDALLFNLRQSNRFTGSHSADALARIGPTLDSEKRESLLRDLLTEFSGSTDRMVGSRISQAVAALTSFHHGERIVFSVESLLKRTAPNSSDDLEMGYAVECIGNLADTLSPTALEQCSTALVDASLSGALSEYGLPRFVPYVFDSFRRIASLLNREQRDKLLQRLRRWLSIDRELIDNDVCNSILNQCRHADVVDYELGASVVARLLAELHPTLNPIEVKSMFAPISNHLSMHAEGASGETANFFLESMVDLASPLELDTDVTLINLVIRLTKQASQDLDTDLSPAFGDLITVVKPSTARVILNGLSTDPLQERRSIVLGEVIRVIGRSNSRFRSTLTQVEAARDAMLEDLVRHRGDDDTIAGLTNFALALQPSAAEPIVRELLNVPKHYKLFALGNLRKISLGHQTLIESTQAPSQFDPI